MLPSTGTSVIDLFVSAYLIALSCSFISIINVIFTNTKIFVCSVCSNTLEKVLISLISRYLINNICVQHPVIEHGYANKK